MKIKFISLLLCMGLSPSVFSSIVLQVPEEIVLNAINNVEVKPSFIKANKQFTLEAQKNLVNLRYQHYFELPLKQHEIVKSDYLTVEIPVLADNQTYKVVLINPPKDVDQAKEFATNPTLGLLDQDQKITPLNIVQVTQQKPITRIFASRFNQTNNVLTDQQDSAHVISDRQKNIENKEDSARATKSNLVQQTMDQQLIQIWKNASKAERQKFMSWLATQ